MTHQCQGNAEEGILQVEDCVYLVVRWKQAEQGIRIRHGGMDGFHPLVDFSQILYRSIVLGICLKDWKKGGIPRRGTRPENPGV